MQRWEAERTAASLAVDLDLAEVGSDERSGLLRLARWYGQFPVGEAVLREFVAVPSLAVGQRFTPLLAVHLSPDTRDKLSPDGRTVLANRPGAALLMDVRSGREVAIRQATEQVLNAGWADGGRTAYTDSLDGVVRLWDTATGNLRAATAPRPLRHHPTFHDDGNGKEVCSVAGRRMVTWGCWEVLAAGSRRGNPSYTAGLRQPVELWDAGTGQLVRRFALPPTQLKAVKLLGDRWAVVAVEDHAPRVFSCITGDEVARLPVEDSVYDNVYINPSGTRLMVRSVSAGVRRWAWLEEWDTARWNRIHPPLKVDTMVTRYSTYLTDGVFA
jgi:WD40 repeat protein